MKLVKGYSLLAIVRADLPLKLFTAELLALYVVVQSLEEQ